MQAGARRRIAGRLLRLGVSGGARSAAEDPTALEELETEVALLREENAWLKVERQRPPDLGRILERARSLAQAEEDPAQQREGLLAACGEIKQAVQRVGQRLSGLTIAAEEAGEARVPAHTLSGRAGELGAALGVDDAATSGFSKTAA